MPPHKRLPWDASGASHDGTLWPRHYGVTGIPTISQVMNGVEAVLHRLYSQNPARSCLFAT
jgi:hypothetical protein